MGFPQGKGIGSILKNHYEKILYRYDVFKSNGNGAVDNKETTVSLLLKYYMYQNKRNYQIYR